MQSLNEGMKLRLSADAMTSNGISESIMWESSTIWIMQSFA